MSRAGSDTEPGQERGRSLNHFGVWALTDAYWALAEAEQLGIRRDWVSALAGTAPVVHHYQIFPAEATSDVLVWSAVRADDPGAAAAFFEAHAMAVHGFRRWLRPVQMLWGFTRESEYSRARSRQEIDPFEPRRLPYLVMYPFTKTSEWYQLDAERRQALMNEHMRIGKQFHEIAQLLLYSTGLQDQEFVVVYETPDLMLFSRLVTELRATGARPYTANDAPLHTAMLRSAGDPDRLWP
ncbi:MAG: chlorite dismutase family protein [Gemmatimonadetes bacterium]|nr:chlorite dismutase family protein [Gemmatimonadota bacterium]